MPELSLTQLMAASAERLRAGGFSVVADDEDELGTAIRVFEDPLSVVGIATFPTWQKLEAGWPSSQGFLVELMSSRLARSEPKSWEGYLVLMTTDDVMEDQLSVDRIRRDTSRLRKIVATGSELQTLAGVEDVLLPVLPLDIGGLTGKEEPILGRLPRLLAEHGVDENLGREVVEAFEQNRSPLEAVWQWRQHQ